MQKQNPMSGLAQTAGQPVVTRHDRLWAEMQLKLEDIELSASASGVGGTAAPALGHGNTALEDLRVAQVTLAQAWRRNKEDNAEADDTKAAAVAAQGQTPAEGNGDGLDVGKLESKAAAAPPRSDDGQNPQERTSTGTKPFYLEDKTHADIQSARRRREANDEHFGRVSRGVLDVVQKLETVAKSMIVVEAATKEIWANNNNPDGVSEHSPSIGTAIGRT